MRVRISARWVRSITYIGLGIAALFPSKNWAQDTAEVAVSPDTVVFSKDTVLEVLRMDYNVLSNDSTLLPFFEELARLKNKERGNISILHIGDSHIQGDYLSGAIRTGLQDIFGNAGRGLVFPYTVAKTYAPPDLVSNSNVVWTPKKILHHEDSVPLGVPGYAIVCSNKSFQLRMGVKNLNGHDNSFDRVCVLHGNDSTCYDLGVYTNDDFNPNGIREIGVIDCYDSSKGKWSQNTVMLDNKVNEIVIGAIQSDSQQNQTRIYGFILENSTDTGILYNTSGVGAAQLVNFTRTSGFLDQAASLQPDLVIVSLGTNESYNPYMDTLAFQRQIENMIAGLRKRLPNVSFILTTPPDIVYKYHYPKYMDPVCRAIRRAAAASSVAFWDLNYVMGGRGSINHWHANQLAQNDHIHFRTTGYKLQGYMFLDAVMYSYNRFNPEPINCDYLSEYIQENKPMYKVYAAKPAPLATGKAKVTPTKKGSKYHTVRSGETLSAIARKHGTSVDKICKLNGLKKTSIIRPGQKIKVK
jgi:lysophospholipase L1-like esterase